MANELPFAKDSWKRNEKGGNDMSTNSKQKNMG
jgi:hypothetical protein